MYKVILLQPYFVWEQKTHRMSQTVVERGLSLKEAKALVKKWDSKILSGSVTFEKEHEFKLHGDMANEFNDSFQGVDGAWDEYNSL